MGAFQIVAEKVTQLTKLATGCVVKASQSLMAAANKKTESLSLDEMSRRVSGASRTLRGESPTATSEPATAQEKALKVAEAMVSSYRFSRKTGVATFTIPAGVTDSEAMRAVNEYFRERLPEFGRVAIFAGDFDWYEKNLKPRDPSQPREITITAVVKQTAGETRSAQEKILASNGLGFSDERDLALAAALHACAKKGEDLFQGKRVRGSVPGFALGTYPGRGVSVFAGLDAHGSADVAGAGSPSPKKDHVISPSSDVIDFRLGAKRFR